MKLFISIIAAFFILLCHHTTSFSQQIKTVYFKSLDGTKIKAYMMRPKRRGRYGAIVAMHGCSGVKKSNGELFERHSDWAKRFVRWGYVVLFPDSYSPRGVKSLCTASNPTIRQSQRKQDAQAARIWLSKQRFVNRRNITALGWSNGGGTVLRLAYSTSGKGFRRAFAFYPGCRSLAQEKKLKKYIPITILAGRKDDWTPPEPCRRIVNRWGGKMISYRGAYHGFDMPNFPVRTRLWMPYSKRGDGIVHIGTNHRARNMAIEFMRNALR